MPRHIASAAFGKVPVMDYAEVRDGTGMVFIAQSSRQRQKGVDPDQRSDRAQRQPACLICSRTARSRRLFHRVHMSRWYVPVDDTHSIIYGWRMFGESIDPLHMGDESKVGWDDMDFLVGQVGDRPYESPSARLRLGGHLQSATIAIHALEHPMASDIGVFLNRKLIRNALRGKNPAATPEAMHARATSDCRPIAIRRTRRWTFRDARPKPRIMICFARWAGRCSRSPLTATRTAGRA